jgi:hypothetical protein
MMRILRASLWLVLVMAVALVATAHAVTGEGVSTMILPVVHVLGFGGVGAFLIGRLPRHPIGWLLGWFGISFSLGYSADQVARWAFANGDHELAAWLGWYESWSFLLGLPLVLTLLPLWFPDGQPPTPRWRWVTGAAVLGVLLAVVGQATRPDAMLVDLPNPLGRPLPAAMSEAIFAVGAGILLIAALGGVGALVVRFRRSRGRERQQIKWLLSAVGFAALVFAVLAPVLLVVDTPAASDTALTGIMVGMLAVPTGVAVAILRHRLYDIDVIINRTLVYGSLTATLVLIYLGGVATVQATFRLFIGQEQQSQLAVVASTLAVAALFMPLRRRIQAFIDRRFYRRKYDSRKTLQAFSATLRDETHLEALNGELVEVVRETMQPVHASLWLRSPAEIERGGEEPSE